MASKKGSKSQSKKSKSDGPEPTAPFDLSRWMQNMQIPGVDVSALIDSGRADLETVQRANQIAVEGWQKLAQKQTELLQTAIEEWQTNLTESVSRKPEENLTQQAQIAQQGFQKMLEGMREMAQIVTESQTEAAEVLGKRFEENIKRTMNPGAAKD